jgi:hypothetical protein
LSPSFPHPHPPRAREPKTREADQREVADLFANDCEQLPAKATLSTARIAQLVRVIIEQHNYFALAHLFAALVADSSANRRQQMTREALRCLLLAIKAREG